MATFPLPILPTVPWHDVAGSKNTFFGASRNDNFPVHGACDLIAPPDTPVLAVDDGEILCWPYSFATYEKKAEHCKSTTFAVDVRHAGFIARYCEISPKLAPGLIKGSPVTEGQVIGKVGLQCGGSMLHFEMFNDQNRIDDLTDRSHKTKYKYVPQANYERRNDLLDPTTYLDAWCADLKVKLHRQMDLSI